MTTISASRAAAGAAAHSPSHHEYIFADRHIGPSEDDVRVMLDLLGYPTLEHLARATVPDDIRVSGLLRLPQARSEHAALADLRQLAGRNRVMRSCIGMGYHHTHVPAVILRNILENPGWYTQYTPYQAENRAGSPGGPSQLPDNGLRPHGHARIQRESAR